MERTVGLVGVGAMGGALLSRLMLVGCRVKAFDVAAEGRACALREGAEVASSAAEAARGSGIVHVFVASDEQLLDAALSADGALAGLAPGALLILHSTTLPATTLRIADAAALCGVGVVDAPITSIPSRVRNGLSAFLVGGPDELVDKAATHLETLGGKAYRFGPLGSGNLAKLAKNFVNAAHRALLADALELAQTGGLDGRAFMEMMEVEEHHSLVAQWRKLFDFDTTPARLRPFPNLFDKDIRLAAELAKSLGMRTPALQGAAEGARLWTEDWAASAPERS
jgi:3-hydroxyisobutyrate dehydrogenase